MIVTVSGMVFILLTASFGVTIDFRDGSTRFDLEPGSDWSNPTINKPSEDYFNVNPMRQFPDWIYLSMVIGYFISVGILCHSWFRYCQWKWEHIPVIERFDEKKVKIKVPDNALYRIELNRRKQNVFGRKNK